MICYAPWHALSIRFNGDVVPDCVYTGRHGNLLKESLPQILSNSGLKKTQLQLLSGTIPNNTCSQCIEKEKITGHSRRIFFDQILKPVVSDQNYGIEIKDIHFLEFNMSNICNLKCRMCSGVNSTAWIKEDYKLSKFKNFQRPINHPDFGYKNLSMEIVDRLFEFPQYFKKLQFVNIKGGEPYMEPANKKILKYLIKLDIAKNISLDISTNGTIIDKEFDDLAMQFKETKWHISIEGVGKLYEYIRGGDNFTFENLEKNLQHFSKFDRVIFAGTVMTYNVCHLQDIKIWFEKIKKKNYELYLNNVVASPYYLNPSILPEKILQDTGYQSVPNKFALDTFVDYTKELDKLRSTNVLDVCPELYCLFA